MPKGKSKRSRKGEMKGEKMGQEMREDESVFHEISRGSGAMEDPYTMEETERERE